MTREDEIRERSESWERGELATWNPAPFVIDIRYVLNALKVEKSVSKDLLHRGQSIQQENQRLREALDEMLYLCLNKHYRFVHELSEDIKAIARQALQPKEQTE